MSFSIKSSHEYSSQFSKNSKKAPKNTNNLFDDEFDLDFDSSYNNGSQAKTNRGGSQSSKMGLAIKQTPDAQSDFY